ncbi:hypothetical protein BVRB_6g146030 [Beta vulgaris subsp. vulgaris]|uniref:uncharacterized protein At1g08160 n=1 Tax=Beta vulgaris subsp. vulgaris TaxID=3555 RepID=UPI00053F7A6D|nr:uncharacterized protein At1g08160 [Beta vulgaris subsp. vulgaris]KMT07907.1 hypothetical protein BVRB_6g146030 [Beta vulgaris subsp. vulgaris]
MPISRTSQNPTAKKRSPITLCAIVCLALIVIVGLAILITWLAIKPKKIQYSVDEGWIRDYNLTNGHLTSTFNFVLRTYNPNHKASIYYDKMDVTVYYRGQNVAYDKVEPFHQPKQNVTRIMFQNTAKDVTLQSDSVKYLKNERNGGQVDLDIKIKAKIRFKVGLLKTRHYKVKILCSPVVVNFSDDKRFQKVDCDVDY